MSDSVLLDVHEGVATVTLNEPRIRNALTPALRVAFREVMATLEFDDDVRAVVITGAGSPAKWTSTFKEAGLLVGHVVPSARLAQKSHAAGVDFVVAESNEAGGHVRPQGLATLSLVPQVVDAVPIPVVAAGGITDGRGVAAALALGVAEFHQDAVVQHLDGQTIVVERSVLAGHGG